MPPADRPVLAIASLGGTITMTPQADGGIVPTLQAADLVAAVPGLDVVADLRAATLAARPSASLTETDVLQAVDWARDEVDRGAVGAVIVQGTDTLEETSFLADCVWEHNQPLVFTGAMRGAAQASADGPGNLLASAMVAASPQARGLGAVVVLDDVVHRAALVHKAHTTALSAFASYGGQVAGRVVEGEVWLTPAGPRLPARRLPVDAELGFVPICSTYLGDDGRVLRRLLADDPAGIVIAGFGAGHVSELLAEVVFAAVERCPVVVASRIGQGGTTRRTYGFSGSEIDLQRRGAIMAGTLDAVKSRVLLALLVAAGFDNAGIAAEFGRRAVRY